MSVIVKVMWEGSLRTAYPQLTRIIPRRISLHSTGGRVLQRDCGLCCAGCTEKTAPSSVSERLGRWHSLQCLGAPWQRVIIMLKKIYYLKFLEQEDKDEEEEAVEITGVIE